MKKVVKKSFYLLAVMALCFLLSNVSLVKASAENLGTREFVNSSTEYLEDDSYIVYEVYETELPTRGVGAKIGEKVVTKYSAINTVIWTYTLKGYFSFSEGYSSECYNATYEVDINGSSWSFSDGYTYYSYNTAYGQGLFTYKFLGITGQTVEIDINVSCDTYGNIS